MPTNRKRMPRSRANPEIPDVVTEFLKTGQEPESDHPDALNLFLLRNPESEELEKLWKEAKGDIMASWKRSKPGTRPFAFWLFDAPEPRRRIGGKGIADFEHYPAIWPCLKWGLPQYWHNFNESDPPKFESEASYLRRHGLLFKSEEKRLTAADFEPDAI